MKNNCRREWTTMEKKRIRDYGVDTGRMKTGKRNKITDVPGVQVGHCTIKNAENCTGVTVILPGQDNCFSRKYTAAAYVHNGFGKSAGLMQIEELGVLETPIALTNTLNVGIVWDSLAEYVIRQCEKDGIPALSINPVEGECNDSRINRIQNRAVKMEHVFKAIEGAGEDFAEGDVGAGAGTICYGLKGGIGSASRTLTLDGKTYTIGVLVQSNFGAAMDLVLNGTMAGQQIIQMRNQMEKMEAAEKMTPRPMDTDEEDKGSIMTILATDLPVTSRQLKRIIRRTAVGIARTGAYTGHGSGEVMIGFTTANRIPASGQGKLLAFSMIPEESINAAFQAAAEAAHEAILNSMACAGSAQGIGGEMYWSLSAFLPQLLKEAKGPVISQAAPLRFL